MYLFGSHLIKKYFNDFRVPNDIDWVTNDISELKKSTKDEEYYFIPFSPDREMTADEMYTVKVSHAIYDIHWKKTMSDIRFLQIKGCKVIPDLLNQLREYWIEIHGEQKRTDFEVLPGKFFEDRLKRKFDHDDLHKMINPNPTFLKIIDVGVTPNPEKFALLTQDEKKELMFEEAFVISIERFLNQPDKIAYNKAQQNLVTRLHPIWLADFVIENWSKWYWTPSISKFYKEYVTIKNK
jgi:hypothetical protein